MFKILFVHGFGGDCNAAPFVDKALHFINKHNVPCSIEPFCWDSVEFGVKDCVDIRKVSSKFTTATENAVDVVSRFAEKVDELEKQAEPFYIVAHSLGCQLVNNFLYTTTSESKHCKGVLYFGAADDSERNISTSFLGDKGHVINYYSPKSDIVLKASYHLKAGKVAGGSKGFKSDLFVNYCCSATHVRKGVLIHSDWVQMMPAIIELAAYENGVAVMGSLAPNVVMSIGNGETYWNNIIENDKCLYDGVVCSAWVQQHKINGNYRLSVLRPGGKKRKRVAWSTRLEPLLTSMK